MEDLEKNIVVEIDKRVAISFNKKYKNFVDANGDACSLDLKKVKKEITNYLIAHKNHFQGKKVFSFVYDYDTNIAVTVMKRNPEYEVYDVIGFVDMVAPEETLEDDEEMAETKKQMKILKEYEELYKDKKIECLKLLYSNL